MMNPVAAAATSDHDRETIPGLLRRGAALWPDRLFASLPDGSEWTRSQALAEAEITAGKFVASGITTGDRVVLMMPNSADWLRCWWGLSLIGALIVPLNPALRGNILTSMLATIEPKLVVVVRGTEEQIGEPYRQRVMLVEDLMSQNPVDIVALPDIAPGHPAGIIMTSGTTGPSKGSLMPNRQLALQSGWLIEKAGVGEDDVFLADMPLFHLSGMSPITTTMAAGGRFVLRTAPAGSTYWETARDLGATWSYLVGTMANFLIARPPSPAEKEHKLRFVLSAPIPDNVETYKERFNIGGIGSSYGMSEAGIIVIQSPFEPWKANSAGRARDGFDIRIVDAEGNAVPDGTPGELLVRPLEPYRMTLGYYGNEQASRECWAGDYFRTGDVLIRDSDGYFFFQDRAKDALRRRGENISSFEVERDVQAHPDIAEAACVAHPSDFGADDEVKVFCVLREGAGIDWAEVVRFLAERMPYFTVPRYFEPIDALPKTPTNRVQKHLLRARGNGAETWDREAHGMVIGRDGKIRQKGPGPRPRA